MNLKYLAHLEKLTKFCEVIQVAYLCDKKDTSQTPSCICVSSLKTPSSIVPLVTNALDGCSFLHKHVWYHIYILIIYCVNHCTSKYIHRYVFVFICIHYLQMFLYALWDAHKVLKPILGWIFWATKRASFAPSHCDAKIFFYPSRHPKSFVEGPEVSICFSFLFWVGFPRCWKYG